jgi:hypothetical protein
MKKLEKEKRKEKEESKKITESPKSPNMEFNAEEEYKNLPDFIQSMIGNFYYSSSRKSSNSEHFKVSNKNTNQNNNNINISNFNNINDIHINNNININFNNNQIEEEKFDEGGIKIFNIKDNNLAIMKKSFRLKNILQDDFINYRNNIKECSICFRNIINYGLLSNCDDIFCYECIRQWRNEAKQKSKRERFRRCPLCNEESPLLIKSKIYLTGEEKKQKMIEFRNENNNNNN